MTYRYFKDIELRAGIWYGANDDLSYPQDGNEELNDVEDQSFWFGHRNNIIKALMSSYSTSNCFVDLGGGNGYVSRYIQDELDKDVICVEPGRSGVKNAFKRGVKNVVCAVISKDTVAVNSLPDVGMFDVLEHIEFPISFLSELVDLMDCKSRLFVTVPAYQWLWSNEDSDGGHFKRYTTKLLKTELEKAGFYVVYSSYFFSFLPPLIFFLRTIPSFLGIKNSSVQNTSQVKKDHEVNSTFSNKILRKFFRCELKRVNEDKKLYFGSSVIAVAQKRNN